MTTQHVKVGDVVAWDYVPDWTLVKEMASKPFYQCRLAGVGGTCHSPFWHGSPWSKPQIWGRWNGASDENATIIALGLTGNETADELRALAEAFERDHPAA